MYLMEGVRTETFLYDSKAKSVCEPDRETWLNLNEYFVEKKRIYKTAYEKTLNLQESYSLYARYDHTCKKCKGNMKVIKQKDLELQESRSPDHITSNILCPKCKTPLSFEGMIMWD